MPYNLNPAGETKEILPMYHSWNSLHRKIADLCGGAREYKTLPITEEGKCDSWCLERNRMFLESFISRAEMTTPQFST